MADLKAWLETDGNTERRRSMSKINEELKEWIGESETKEEAGAKLRLIAKYLIDLAIKEAVRLTIKEAIKQAREEHFNWLSLTCFRSKPPTCFPSPDIQAEAGRQIMFYCSHCAAFVREDDYHQLDKITPDSG